VHRLKGRVRFYTALGLNEQALAAWEHGVTVFPDLANAAEMRRILRARIKAARGGRR
jgi:hypothetical protein